METNGDSTSRKFIVGLGNPGRKYAETRHNVGFKVLQVLQSRWVLGDGRKAFDGLTWETRIGRSAEGLIPGDQTSVILLAPMTYMNDSGRSVRAMLDFYKFFCEEPQADNLLVVMDDLALPLGQLRFRKSGSDGGHNGLADILQRCSTRDITRLRIGIGAAPGVMDPKDYVLGKFRPDEQEDIGAAIQIAADAVEEYLRVGIMKVMEKYNRKPDNGESP
ncbi:MAG: aminoacyl-tRNA hydrolase [Phycisphaerae bacterium]|nr:aminoacyl-tRNA hydrolase [Phycisphaerae bacterium]